MAGVRNSKFVVAINHDASAAVFSQADVGVVDDWKVVLEALVTTFTQNANNVQPDDPAYGSDWGL